MDFRKVIKEDTRKTEYIETSFTEVTVNTVSDHFARNGSRTIPPGKIPTRNIPTHQTPPWKIAPRKIPTWNISIHFINRLSSLTTSSINGGGSVHVHPPLWTKYFDISRVA